MTDFARRDFKVTTVDGVDIAIRSVRAEGEGGNAGVPMVLMHGTRIPGISEFDLPVPGYSIAEDFARAGHVCYIPDARGFGKSDRPAEMDEPRTQGKPIVRSLEITRDIDAAVDALREETGHDTVGIMGWGTGGILGLMYAALWPEKVDNVVLLNTLYGGAGEHPETGPGSFWDDPERPGHFNQKKYGNYYFNKIDMLRKGWDNQIPIEDKDAWRDPAVVDAFEHELIIGDPTTMDRDPPSYRSPNGMLEDSYYMGCGHKLLHASQVYARVFIINPEHDLWCRDEDVEALKRDLVHSPDVRVWNGKGATHYVFFDYPDRGKTDLMRELLAFLDP